MYLGGPCVIMMSIFVSLGIREVGVLTFLYSGGVTRLKRSSLVGYWKAETPNLGVHGDAYTVEVAPDLSVNVCVPSSRYLIPPSFATDPVQMPTAASCMTAAPPCARYSFLSKEMSWFPAMTSLSSAWMLQSCFITLPWLTRSPFSVRSPQWRTTSHGGIASPRKPCLEGVVMLVKSYSCVSEMMRKRTCWVTDILE